jgi:UDP:flavonoid glycosyltransferase YjiC (YdhE family)
MKEVTANDLANRLAELVGNTRYRDGAAAIATEMAREPGVAGAVAEIGKLLPAT